MDRRTIIFVLSLTFSLFAVRLGFDYYNEHYAPKVPSVQKVVEPKPQEPAAPTTTFQSTPQNKNQEYYLLENDYMQLVISNVGGALVEINLPFKTKNDPYSSVLPIEVDREMVQMSPQNAKFPLHPAKMATGEIREGALGGYYPLIRRDLLAADSSKNFIVPPHLYSLNLVSEYPEVAKLVYEVKSFTKNEIVLEASQPHRRITKSFSFSKDRVPYSLRLDLKVEGDSRGLWLTSGVPEIEWQSGASGSNIKYRISKGKGFEVLKVDLPSQSYTNTSSLPDWVCNSNGFFGIILDTEKHNEAGFRVDKISGNDDPSRLSIVDPEFAKYAKEEMPGFNVLMPAKTMQVRLFAGPFSDEVLQSVDAYYTNTTGTSPDFMACQTYFGWFSFISEPFARFLFFVMKLFYSLTGSWGFSIIFVTVVLRLILYPLNTWSIRSMKGMQEIAPQVKQIQEKYKKDPHKSQMEILALYRSKGVNPVSGCLPLLLQMPFLIGMFDLLKTTFELRGVPFIPGWINNLTSPDVLFRWKTPIPFIGNEFHLLPILLGLTMYLQQNVMANMPKDPRDWTEQQRQQRMMGNIMTVVMTVLFYNFPSGLNLYWISSMLLGMLQQWWTSSNINKKATEAVVEIEVQPKPHHKKLKVK